MARTLHWRSPKLEDPLDTSVTCTVLHAPVRKFLVTGEQLVLSTKLTPRSMSKSFKLSMNSFKI